MLIFVNIVSCLVDTAKLRGASRQQDDQAERQRQNTFHIHLFSYFGLQNYSFSRENQRFFDKN
jgi:hypothetical protein